MNILEKIHLSGHRNAKENLSTWLSNVKSTDGPSLTHGLNVRVLLLKTKATPTPGNC